MKIFKGLIMLFIFMGCSKENVELNGFNIERWKNDRQGCEGYRQQQIENILDQQDKILGLNQNKVTDLLGKPNRHELYKRNQKFFYYDVSCDSATALELRFNALGLCSEANYNK